jgi:hypothetical protein
VAAGWEGRTPQSPEMAAPAHYEWQDGPGGGSARRIYKVIPIKYYIVA